MAHSCKGVFPHAECGDAITYCVERNGEFWVGNKEYESRVNHCPYCGAKALKQTHYSKYPCGSRVLLQKGDTSTIEVKVRDVAVTSEGIFYYVEAVHDSEGDFWEFFDIPEEKLTPIEAVR